MAAVATAKASLASVCSDASASKLCPLSSFDSLAYLCLMGSRCVSLQKLVMEVAHIQVAQKEMVFKLAIIHMFMEDVFQREFRRAKRGHVRGSVAKVFMIAFGALYLNEFMFISPTTLPP